MNESTEILETVGDYRVSITPDDYAEPPDWDGQGTVIQLDYHGAYGWRSEIAHADHGGMRAAIHYGDTLAKAWTHYSDFAQRGNREAMVERYLRIWHGVVGFDYFDTRDGRYVCVVTEVDLTDWGFDSLDAYRAAAAKHDMDPNPAVGNLNPWRDWTEGEVYYWTIERQVNLTTTKTSRTGDYLSTESHVEWDVVEQVHGFYGDTDAREQALEAFGGYVSDTGEVPA